MITTGLSRRWPRWASVALILAALLVGILPTPTALAASSCVVSSTADSGANTLRQCIADVDAGGTITFNLPNPSTITLTSSHLVIGKSLTITGPGEANLTLNGNDIWRIFYVTAGTVAISDLTVTHGKDFSPNGGGISLFGGELTLTNVTVSHSVAASGGGGGLFTWAGTTAAIIDSTFTDNASDGGGGGVFIQGTATLTNCTISGNSSESGGGGLTVLGSATISSSSISGNTGGGVELYKTGFSGDPGGMTILNSTISGNSGSGVRLHANQGTTVNATIINSTISGNSAAFSGGGLYIDGPVTAALQFLTVTDNTVDSDNNGTGVGGGINREAYINPTVQILGSIIAGNRKGTSTANDCAGILTSQGGNLWGDTTTCPSNGAGDLNLATLGKTIGQVLAPLAENGGPTKTHALVAGSPAIDLVPNASCAPATGKDQRGSDRPAGAACDAGAVEGAAPQAPTNCAGFDDVAADDPACPAIAELTERGVIKGYSTNPPTFGPGNDVQRAQVAAFTVRLLQWQNKATGPKEFKDFGGLVGELKTASLILANECDDTGICVARGYDSAACAAKHKEYPCFGPNDQVSYAQVISFVARAFQFDETFAWAPQPNGALPYTGVPTVHQRDVRTYHHYVGTIPNAPSTTAGWSAPASRAWIAMVIYQALLTILN